MHGYSPSSSIMKQNNFSEKITLPIEQLKRTLTVKKDKKNQSFSDQSTDKQVDAAAWKHLREGLRLRDIVTSKRMNEIGIDVKNID